MEVTILAYRSEVISCHVILISTRDNVVVEFDTARVTVCRVVEFVLFVRGQFHRFLFVENFVDFLQFGTHVSVKMLHHVRSAIYVRDFVAVLGVFVFRYAEATKSARHVNFAIVLIGRFHETTFEIEIKTNRDEERFPKIFETNFTLIFFNVASAEGIELVRPVRIPVV